MSLDVLGRDLGGERGIRTPDTLSGMPVFKTGAINHSASSPLGETDQFCARCEAIASTLRVRSRALVFARSQTHTTHAILHAVMAGSLRQSIACIAASAAPNRAVAE